MLALIRRSIILKSLLMIFFLSAFISGITVLLYSHQSKMRIKDEIIFQNTEISGTLTEALIEPLRFQNVKEISKVLSPYIGRSISWAIVYDNSNVPIYTIGNVPDIDSVKQNTSLHLNKEFVATELSVSSDNDVKGHLVYGLTLKSFKEKQLQENSTLLRVTGIAFLSTILILGFFAHGILSRINSLSNSILNFNPNSILTFDESRTDEIENIFNVFYKTSSALTEAQLLLSEKIKNEAIALNAAQVAHDIRSPLSIFNILIPQLDKSFGTEKIELLTQAAGRINEIASDLLEKRDIQKILISDKVTIGHIIERIVAEKKLEILTAKKPIEIRFTNNSSKNLYTFLTASSLSRVISNLVNNAMESVSENNHGHVLLSLNEDSERPTIIITDNGKGIPAQILANIGSKGFSHGKDNGNGLGVYHAKSTIESAGGVIGIQSELGQGTTVSIKL